MTRSDFTYTCTGNGYSISYRNQLIYGVETIESSYQRVRKNWKVAEANRKMYRDSAEREINNLLNGYGDVNTLTAIKVIDTAYNLL